MESFFPAIHLQEIQSFLYTYCSVINHAAYLRPRSEYFFSSDTDNSQSTTDCPLERYQGTCLNQISGTKSSNQWSANDLFGTIVFLRQPLFVPVYAFHSFSISLCHPCRISEFCLLVLNPSGCAYLYQAYPFLI